jgi:CubicO group peptidase (beta-lactamase class C family)
MKIRLSVSATFPASVFAMVLLTMPACSTQPAKLEASKSEISSVDAKIKLIETSLAPAFITTETKRWTIQERMTHYAVPGVSIALINNGKVEWVRAYGVRDAKTKEPVTTDTLFQAASISKPVSALGAMLLVEQGKLALDENVNAKLTSWKLPENSLTQVTPVTLRALLTHTAGTTVHGFRGYAVDEAVPTVPQILDGAKPANSDPVRVDTTPRTKWRYSGGGTTIVQQLVADVARQPFADYMRERVLVPAGMTRSSYEQPLSSERAANAASGHNKGEPVRGKWHVYPELAAAGLWTTPRDLATFAIEVQRASSGGASTWLKQATAKQMVNDIVSKATGIANGSPPWAIGFGLDTTRGNTRFMHGGSNEGFQCNLVAYVGDGRGIVVMTNGDSGSRLIEEIERAAAFAYEWKELAPTVHALVTLKPTALDAFVGEYEGDGGMAISILRDRGQLFGRAAGMGWDKLHATGATQFITEGSQLTVEFSTDANGKSNALSLITHEGTTRAARRDGKAFQFATVPIFLRGSMNNWNTGSAMQPQGSTVYTTEIELDRGDYEFKFGSEDFNAVAIGGAAANAPVVVGKPSTLAPVGSNIKLKIEKKARYTFVLDVKNPLAPTVMITVK